jgi:DNA-binding transcriptional LysR family regulator
MRLEHLKLFCDVAELGSFSAAATLHELSLAAVSRQVRQLEDRYGKEFFERGRKRLTLTPHGQKFAKAARRILAIADSIPQLLR